VVGRQAYQSQSTREATQFIFFDMPSSLSTAQAGLATTSSPEDACPLFLACSDFFFWWSFNRSRFLFNENLILKFKGFKIVLDQKK